MKAFITLLCILAMPVMHSSCKKNSSAPPATTGDYYIKLKINGTAKSMTMTPIVLFSQASVLYTAELSGYFANNTGLGANLALHDAAAFNTTATYTQQYVSIGGTPVSQTVFNFRNDDGNSYLVSAANPGTSFTLNFSEIASDHVKGTFSGTLWLPGSNSTFVQITEGAFYLKRYQ